VTVRWWREMAGLMETEPDFQPVRPPLLEVFHQGQEDAIRAGGA
jgi:L-rhamnose mutarotase